MSRPGPLPRVPCFVCGEQATLDGEKKTHIDYDCARCGRLRVTGRVFFLFPPRALQAFDRRLLSERARAIPPDPANNNRRVVDEGWMHRQRLVRIMMVDHAMTEADALAHIDRHPGADLSDESLLDTL
ncbi:hypothetical protein NFI95_03750 [Acetobacteraceae bacterium KSS8]|uniref:RNHCP domain-containing protein n=1 Tax=Endosaccharibacter trunci TaxID=2812733 RepID=A0ABT1W6V7_9PROT|nr:hypothetical protein [Acetobacteraceae bacterium KSS8]